MSHFFSSKEKVGFIYSTVTCTNKRIPSCKAPLVPYANPWLGSALAVKNNNLTGLIRKNTKVVS